MWLTVTGAGKQTLICDNLKATETHVDFKDFNKEAIRMFFYNAEILRCSLR